MNVNSVEAYPGWADTMKMMIMRMQYKCIYLVSREKPFSPEMHIEFVHTLEYVRAIGRENFVHPGNDEIEEKFSQTIQLQTFDETLLLKKFNNFIIGPFQV